MGYCSGIVARLAVMGFAIGFAIAQVFTWWSILMMVIGGMLLGISLLELFVDWI